MMRPIPNRFFDVARASAMTVGYVGKDPAAIRELFSGFALLLMRSGISATEVEEMMLEAVRGVPDEYLDGSLPMALLN